MKRILLFAVVFMSIFDLTAQYKIAVVNKITGITSICPSLDSAYSHAQSGDYIYLPAGTFSFSPIIINKRVNIYGTGINADTSLMGVSSISNQIYLLQGSDSSYFEGINFNNEIRFGSGSGDIGDTTAKVNYITFHRCAFMGNILLNNSMGQMLQTNKPINISFLESMISSLDGSFCDNWQFSKCLVTGVIKNLKNSTFLNNSFTSPGLFYSPMTAISYSTLNNNIFLSGFYNANEISNSILQNNINSNSLNASINTIINSIGVPANQIFINTSSAPWYKNDYHLIVGCPGINAGTDGTDLGIYGTAQPTKSGWIPSNPHVYFKNVSNQNNSGGILNATFKVKPQSN